MTEYFFTSDQHFGHFNIIKHCQRPYSSYEEMDEDMIAKWNSLVGENDIVWHLGDLAWFRLSKDEIVERYLKRLNGKINIVFGNHDGAIKDFPNLFNEAYNRGNEVKNRKSLTKEEYIKIKIKKKSFVLSHYCMMSWPGKSYNKKREGSYHLFGHSHTHPIHKPYKFIPCSYDVGVDNNNFYPIPFDEIIKKLESTKDNLSNGTMM